MDKLEKSKRVGNIISYLHAVGFPISQSQAYEVLAKALGLKSKHVLAALPVDSLDVKNIDLSLPTLAQEQSASSVLSTLPERTDTLPSRLSSREYTEYSFLLGNLSGEVGEGILANLLEAFGGEPANLTITELRSEVLDYLEKQGTPCIQVEFDNSTYGGSPSENFIYIPERTITSLTSTSEINAVIAAFKQERQREFAQVLYYNSDDRFTVDGVPFINPKEYVDAETVLDRSKSWKKSNSTSTFVVEGVI